MAPQDTSTQPAQVPHFLPHEQQNSDLKQPLTSPLHIIPKSHLRQITKGILTKAVNYARINSR
jgi:hypothetical protein